MQLLQSIAYILLPLIGVIIGATIQYWFSKKSETLRHYRDLKTNAYVDFLRSVAEIVNAQKSFNKNEEQKFTALLSDSKTRIIIYGSEKVIKAISNFSQAGAILDSPERMKLFINIIIEMRKDSLPKYKMIPDKEISQILFSLALKEN